MKCSYPGGVAPPGKVKAPTRPRPLYEVRIPIEVRHGEPDLVHALVAGAPISLTVLVRADNGHEAAERVLDALQRMVDR
jgi:hypothetical protein